MRLISMRESLGGQKCPIECMEQPDEPLAGRDVRSTGEPRASRVGTHLEESLRRMSNFSRGTFRECFRETKRGLE